MKRKIPSNLFLEGILNNMKTLQAVTINIQSFNLFLFGLS
jgi:hypothetical protein